VICCEIIISRQKYKKGVPILTIKDLSAQTGYSVGTISRVLNNQPNVSQKARETILRAANECGFQLNANAKQLKQQHGNSILVLVKGRHNELFGSLVESIQEHIAEKYPLIVEYMDESENEVLKALKLCREKKPLGVLFLGGDRENFLADFDKVNMPGVLVTCDASNLPFANLSSVSSDDILAGRTAIEHLISLGHRKIAIIGGPRIFSSMTQERYRGCVEAFREYGVDFDEELDYESTRFSLDWGYKAARQLLEKNRGYTAIFAMADVMAIGAIRALQDAGLRVPEDVSVVGLDGLTIGAYTVPRLTTIAQDVEALAERSVRILLDKIENQGTAHYEIVPVSLVDRESAQKLN
jgi:LacI family transcriptional regulator